MGVSLGWRYHKEGSRGDRIEEYPCENLCEKNFQNVLNRDKIRKNMEIKNLVLLNTSLTLRRLGSSKGLICNQRVGGSNPSVGSIYSQALAIGETS
jgi:hypothetical protein